MNVEDYKKRLHDLIDKINDSKNLERLYKLAIYLYLKADQ